MVSSRSSSPVGGVDDSDVEVVDEHDDVGSGVGSSDADAAELAVNAEGDGAGLVDAVVADPDVGVGVWGVAGQGFGHDVEQGRGGRPVWQGAVRAPVVVFIDELGSEDVSRLLGHSSDDVTTQHYIRTSAVAPDLSAHLQIMFGPAATRDDAE